MNASIFFLLAGDLDHELLGPDVDDPAAEVLHQGPDLRADGRRGVDLDEHQVALDEVLTRDVDHLDDGDDLLQLLADLLQDPVIPLDHEADPGKMGVLGLADGQAVDVEPAGVQHPGDVREDPRLVLDQGREDVAHAPGMVRPAARAGHRLGTPRHAEKRKPRF